MYLFTNSPVKDRRAGVALLMVLGMVALLGWFAVEIISKVRDEIAIRGHDDRSREEVRASAFQALEVTMAIMAQFKEIEGDLYGKSQGWGYPLEFVGLPNEPFRFEHEVLLPEDEEDRIFGLDEEEELLEEEELWEDDELLEEDPFMEVEMRPVAFPEGVRLSVRVVDQTGKFPLNSTSEARWKLIFEVLGFESTDANTLTDSLLDWIDRDNSPRLYGAEREHYEQMEPPYAPRNGPIKDFEELRLIQGFSALFFDENGMPMEVFEQFKRMVTVRDVENINYNAADYLVLQVLEEENDLPADELQEYLAGEDGIRDTMDDRVLRPELTPDSGFEIILDEMEEMVQPPTYENGRPLESDRPVRFVDVYIEASVGEMTYRIFAGFDLETPHPGGIYPFAIIEFREDSLSF